MRTTGLESRFAEGQFILFPAMPNARMWEGTPDWNAVIWFMVPKGRWPPWDREKMLFARTEIRNTTTWIATEV